MDKKIIYTLVIIFVVFASGTLYFYLTNKTPAPEINQGLYGKVTLNSGNCMPGAGGCKTSSVSRKIYIREPVIIKAIEITYLKEKTDLVKQIKSSGNGNYQVELPPGTYSVFIEDYSKEYCNSFGGQGEVCQVTVGDGMVEYNINIDHAVW